MKRKTLPVMKVASALMSDPLGKHWGYETGRQAGVRSGVLYPVLRRLLEDGLLTDGWETPAEMQGHRPPRRYYELTDLGDGNSARWPWPPKTTNDWPVGVW